MPLPRLYTHIHQKLPPVILYLLSQLQVASQSFVLKLVIFILVTDFGQFPLVRVKS